MQRQWTTVTSVGSIHLIRVSTDGVVACSTCLGNVAAPQNQILYGRWSRIDDLNPAIVRPELTDESKERNKKSEWKSPEPTTHCEHVARFLTHGRFAWGSGPGGLRFPIWYWKRGGEVVCWPQFNDGAGIELLGEAVWKTLQGAHIDHTRRFWVEVMSVAAKALFEQGWDIVPRRPEQVARVRGPVGTGIRARLIDLDDLEDES